MLTCNSVVTTTFYCSFCIIHCFFRSFFFLFVSRKLSSLFSILCKLVCASAVYNIPLSLFHPIHQRKWIGYLLSFFVGVYASTNAKAQLCTYSFSSFFIFAMQLHITDSILKNRRKPKRVNNLNVIHEPILTLAIL